PDASPLAARLAERAKEIIARYPEGKERSALLPLLHLVQAEDGYVTPEGVSFCAEQLGITRAQVGAVATFYTMYKRKPTGHWLCTLKEMALQLAGFAEERDGAVAEGPAGEPTLRGNRLAEQYGVSVAGFDPDTPIPTQADREAQQ